MSRILRVLLLLALILPLASKAPVQADIDTGWQGTVVHSVAVYADGIIPPPTGFHPATKWERSQYLRQTYSILGDLAAASVSYTEVYKEQQWYKVNQPEECLGQLTVEYRGSNIASVQASVYVDSRIVNVSVPRVTALATKTSTPDACWARYGRDPYPAVWEAGEYLRPWVHGGAFSQYDLDVIGRDTWPHRNWDYPPGGPRSRQTVFTSYNLHHEGSDTPWLSTGTKDFLDTVARRNANTSAVRIIAGGAMCLTGVACPLGAVMILTGVVGGGISAYLGYLAKDPPDPNYTEIALPVTPATSRQPILPGDGVTEAQADAFNALIENDQQGIGLARAMLTSFDRASGARAAGNSYWVNRQLQAARLYSGQLADILDAQPQLLANLQQALLTAPGVPFAITAGDLSKYKYNLNTQGFSTEQKQLLTELGMDTLGQEEILNALLETEFAPGALPEDTVAIFPDFLTDPELLEATQNLAAALREFSQTSSGHAVYLPLVVR